MRLAERSVAEQRPAVVLSTYPGKDYQMAHAVGRDALASGEAIVEDLAGAVEAGPSPRAMDSLDLAEDNGLVTIRFQRFRQGVAAKEPV